MTAYNPLPPRVWSRVQSSCTYTDEDANYDEIFIPLTNQVVTQGQANYESKLIYKGNILQHKANSARLTKSQRYSQLARCCGPNRTKVFATQSQTYSNPNTTGLLRVGYVSYPFPNQIVGAPNNISGPFAYGIPNPNECPGNSVQVGGTLVCGTYVNPCNGEIYKNASTNATICNPSSASDVPGSDILCWNKNLQSWFPRSRYIMNNSGDKWPEGYKGFVSAIQKDLLTLCTPTITLVSIINDIVTVSWKTNSIFRIDSFNIYINGRYYKNVINDDTYLYSIPTVGLQIEFTDIGIKGVNIEGDNNMRTKDFNMVDKDETPIVPGRITEPLQTIFLTSLIEESTQLVNNFARSESESSNKLDIVEITKPVDLVLISTTTITNKLNQIITKIDQNAINVDNRFISLNETIDNNLNITTEAIESQKTYLDIALTNLQVFMQEKCSLLGTELNSSITNLQETVETQYYNLDASINYLQDTVEMQYDDLDASIKNLNDTVETQYYNLDESIANLQDNLDDSINKLQDTVDTQFNKLQDTVETQYNNLDASLNTITSLITDLVSTTSDILEKVIELKKCCCDCKCNCEFYSSLFTSPTISTINSYVLQYVSTAYEETTTYIPASEYDSLKVGLLSLEDLFAEDPSCCYFNIIDIYRNMLTTVKNAFDSKILTQTTLANSEDWKEDSAILRDPTKLQEYIDSFNKNYVLLDLAITAPKATVKAQYQMYHDLYGVPNNLEYNPELMKPILENLGLI